jgi:DNA-binding protein HU-beta
MAAKVTKTASAGAKPAKAAPAKAAAPAPVPAGKPPAAKAAMKAAPAKTAPAPKAAAPAAKTGAPPAAKPAAAPVVTLKQIGVHLSETRSIPKKDVEGLLGGLIETLTDHLKKGDRIRIGGLGVLEVKSRAARMGRNPATGAPIEIKASKKIAFRPAKELKEAV